MTELPTQADIDAADATYNVLSAIHSRVNCQYEHRKYLAEQFARHRISSANEAIEEAAKVAEIYAKRDWESYDPHTIAAAIRALKSGSASHGG